MVYGIKWIVSEVDDSKEARLLRVLPSDNRAKSVISNNTFSEYNRVGIKSHLSIRLFVLSQIIGAWCAVV